MRDLFRKILLIGWKTSSSHPTEVDPFQYLLAGGSAWYLWLETYKAADKKAIYYGKKYRNTYTYLYLFSVLAVVFGLTNAGLNIHSQWSIIFPCGELLSLGSIAWFYRSEKKNNWHHQWIQQRFHAEYIRCLPLICSEKPNQDIYTNLADVGAEERRRLHELLFNSEPQLLNCLAYALALAKNQQHYFTNVSLREAFIGRRVEQISYVLFTITVIAVMMEFFFHSGWIMVITTLLPASTASIHGAMEAEESERIERRSQIMAQEMKDWLDQYENHTNKNINKGMSELAGLLLSDVEGWHKLMKDRSIHIG
jgi:hypothetical protein